MNYETNIGSLFLFIWIGLSFGISGLFIVKIKRLPEKIKHKIESYTENLFFNGLIGFL